MDGISAGSSQQCAGSAASWPEAEVTFCCRSRVRAVSHHMLPSVPLGTVTVLGGITGTRLVCCCGELAQSRHRLSSAPSAPCPTYGLLWEGAGREGGGAVLTTEVYCLQPREWASQSQPVCSAQGDLSFSAGHKHDLVEAVCIPFSASCVHNPCVTAERKGRFGDDTEIVVEQTPLCSRRMSHLLNRDQIRGSSNLTCMTAWRVHATEPSSPVRCTGNNCMAGFGPRFVSGVSFCSSLMRLLGFNYSYCLTSSPQCP